MELLDQTVGWIARNVPGSTRIFHEHQLDFCCGGNQPLRVALQNCNLAPMPIVEALTSLQDVDVQEKDWRDSPKKELVAFIQTTYHTRHREQLQELIRMASRVEQVHGRREGCPNGLAVHLHGMLEDLDDHMRKEEEILFPMLERGFSVQQVAAPISVMREAHVEHGDALHKLYALTNGITPPKGACNTWRALYAGLRQFSDELVEHIHLENNILFAENAVSEGA
ncbi:Regulator of cell morphogenesis and NO signaling (RCMNS) [gamma proteobacterium HdN1]|nr:Regulator of cell morphogenesis and NO signaling (RCMNS) [gamma proteobacterium HdN1]